ncbi:MAG: exodeoxyribonuclease VII small subunit [Alphaproteobacteria bacterium]|jgi:exodeoxyribonuclease VII small subunit|nr:exodeoxyribonuclease VII small subunit [Alphaproteobacteria bacterium]
MSADKKDMSFEDGMKNLEGILQKLETGDMPLEDAMKSFEEGMKLHGHCKKLLDEAELKIEKIVEKGGVLTTEKTELNG